MMCVLLMIMTSFQRYTGYLNFTEKKRYKSRFIAYSSSTTELSIPLNNTFVAKHLQKPIPQCHACFKDS